jgi:hypothetical protein
MLPWPRQSKKQRREKMKCPLCGVLAVEVVIGEPVSVRCFPCCAGKYSEFLLIQPKQRDPGFVSAPKISWLRRNSLSHGTGNFLEITANLAGASGSTAFFDAG